MSTFRDSRMTVSPGKPLFGQLTLPGDKSLSHRAALLAALAAGESEVRNFLVAGVTRAMLNALAALGVEWELRETTLNIQGRGLRGLLPPDAPLDCGNSGTTLRLLAGALAAARVRAVLDGSPGLRRRPMDRIVEPLQLRGVPIKSTDGRAPLRLRPADQPLRPLDYALPVASAQVKSCLLLSGLAASGPTILSELGPSRDHTERMLRAMGAAIEWDAYPNEGSYRTRLDPQSPAALTPLSLGLPGDFSSAAFLIVAALVTPGSQIELPEVGLNPTRTGLLEALREMGADIQVDNVRESYGEPVGDLRVHHAQLEGIQVEGQQVVRMIDEFPAFAVAAAFARGATHVSQAGELRHKESDRIGALCAQLRALGVRAEEKTDGFVIYGGDPPRGGVAGAHGDHRLAMALALVGLAARGQVAVEGAGVIAESFPGFAEALGALGADVSMEART